MTEEIFYDAFISYRDTEPDRSFVRELVTDLESVGYKIAIDKRDFIGGETFLDEIDRCIRQSRFTLAVISPRYFQSGNTQQEARIQTILDMSERRRRLIPLVLERADMPSWLRALSGIDFSTGDPLFSPLEKLKSNMGPPLLRGVTALPPVVSTGSPMLRPSIPAGCKFVHTSVTAKGFLEEELRSIAPYEALFDPTDLHRPASKVSAILHLPNEETLTSVRTRRTQFTALTAICCLDPEQISSAFLRAVEASGFDITKSASNMRFDEKEWLFSTMAAAMDGAFVVAVAVPPTFLRVGQNYSAVYHAMCGIFLVPLIDLHRQLGIQQLDLRLQAIGTCTDKLLSLAKQEVSSAYPKRGSWSVELIKDGDSLAAVGKMARYVAWAVERFYNSTISDLKFISYLQRSP